MKAIPSAASQPSSATSSHTAASCRCATPSAFQTQQRRLRRCSTWASQAQPQSQMALMGAYRGLHGRAKDAARGPAGSGPDGGWGGGSRVAEVLTAARVAPAPVVPEGTPNARVVVDKFLFFILAHFCYPLLALDHPPVLRVLHILLGLPVLERSWQLVFRVLLPQSPDT